MKRTCCVIGLSCLITHAFAANPTNTLGKFYIGIFGGQGQANHFSVSQFGTVYFTEASGGPLAINAVGDTNNRPFRLVGAQVGYQVPAILLNSKSPWMLVPAAELESYYLNKTTFTGNLANNDVTRIPEHNFAVTYPINRSVYLANAVFNLNVPNITAHPYIGIGFGGAIVKMTNADATQTSPPEPGINHYNSAINDTSQTFARQIKVGLGYDINDYINLFAEYRRLYLSSTHFTLGSTIDPQHAPTSPWQVKLNSQVTRIGTIGIRLYL